MLICWVVTKNKSLVFNEFANGRQDASSESTTEATRNWNFPTSENRLGRSLESRSFFQKQVPARYDSGERRYKTRIQSCRIPGDNKRARLREILVSLDESAERKSIRRLGSGGTWRFCCQEQSGKSFAVPDWSFLSWKFFERNYLRSGGVKHRRRGWEIFHFATSLPPNRARWRIGVWTTGCSSPPTVLMPWPERRRRFNPVLPKENVQNSST